MWNMWDRRKTYTWLSKQRNTKARDHLEDLVVKGRMILKYIFKEYDGRVRNVFMRLRIGTAVGLL
jgi:hypothetical protein